MNSASTYILELLNDDMVSHGLIAQCIEQCGSIDAENPLGWEAILYELLQGKVEIGIARKTSNDYVEFIAWKGTVEERIARASDRVDNARNSDQEFAYWLCLRKNIDRYE